MDVSPNKNENEDIPLETNSFVASMESPRNETWEPEVGMEFDSEDTAFEFYNKYAGKKGFSVRKSSRTITTIDVITRRMFVCSNEGFPVQKRLGHIAKRKRMVTRTGCLARMVIKLTTSGKYFVSEFEPGHNHEWTSPSKVHMLRSQRSITASQSAQVRLAYDTGIEPKRIHEFMGKQAGGRENVGFTHMDLKNQQRSDRMNALEKGEASALLDYFNKKRIENSSFFYALQVDENGEITSIFWADAKSIIDYGYFGDVVCFDTTFKTNSYHRPLAPFVGVNQHKQSIIFCAALLFDESLKTFKWLFEVFQSTMSGKAPKTIFTDQCAAMIGALEEIWPETTHRLCVWHMYRNATKHLSFIFRSQKKFVSDFGKCVYDYEEEDEFLLAWDAMLDKYNLKENKWLNDLYKEKEKWALVYGRHTFSADMMSTQRSESLNSLLKKYLGSKLDVFRFFKHYDRVLEERRYAELQADFYARQTSPSIPPLQMLRQAAKVYTPAIFDMFHKEFQLVMGYSVQNINEIDNIVRYSVVFEENSAKHRVHIITFDSSTDSFACGCKKFEFVGILCRHVLKVFDFKNIKTIPSKYILKRWTNDAKLGMVRNNEGLKIIGDPKVDLSRRFSYLCQTFVPICAEAAESEETFALLESKSRILMDEVIKALQKVSSNGCSLASSNDQVECHLENVNIQDELIEDRDLNHGTKTVVPTSSIVINDLKKKKEVQCGRPKKFALDKKKRKKKIQGDLSAPVKANRNEPSITQQSNKQHAATNGMPPMNPVQNHLIQGITNPNYQFTHAPFIQNYQYRPASASSLLSWMHAQPISSNSQLDLQHTTQFHQSGSLAGTIQYPHNAGLHMQPNQQK